MTRPRPHHYVRVLSHDEFRPHKTRNPPWIKWPFAHQQSYLFTSLTDAQKWHCVGLATLACRTSNHVPADARWLKNELHASGRVRIEPLIEAGFVEWCGCAKCRGMKSPPRTYEIAALPEERP